MATFLVERFWPGLDAAAAEVATTALIGAGAVVVETILASADEVCLWYVEAESSSDVTAVFAANDHMALGLLRAFHERGVRVPEDVSVVGFDDIPEAGYLIPPLTTVRPDHEEVGLRAVTALLSLIEEEQPAEIPLVTPTLIRRSSTARRI